MRQTISGLVAAFAVMTAGAAPAMACGGGLFTSCSPCAYAAPCAPAPVYVAPVAAYSGCNTGCGWAHERLPDPVHQYYYVNQGPTYTGPGNWAPRPVYQEDALPAWSGYRHRSHYDSYRARPHYGYRYSVRPSVRYGYAPRRGYMMPRYSMHQGMRYGMRHGAHRHGAPRYSAGHRMDGQHMMRHRY